MYTTDGAKPPKRPVITSLAGALAEIRRWLVESQLDQVSDAEGQVWQLSVKATLVPEPGNPKGLLWDLKVGFETQVTAAALVATGVLDPGADARLVGLLGEDPVTLRMKPLTYQAPSEVAARALLAQVLPPVKADLAKTRLAEVKRTLVGRWLDARCRFGGVGSVSY